METDPSICFATTCRPLRHGCHKSPSLSPSPWLSISSPRLCSISSSSLPPFLCPSHPSLYSHTPPFRGGSGACLTAPGKQPRASVSPPLTPDRLGVRDASDNTGEDPLQSAILSDFALSVFAAFFPLPGSQVAPMVLMQGGGDGGML